MSIGFKKFLQKTALLLRRVAHILLAVEATNLAENLPDGVAIGVTTGIAREEKHLADLLFRICLAKTSAL